MEELLKLVDLDGERRQLEPVRQRRQERLEDARAAADEVHAERVAVVLQRHLARRRALESAHVEHRGEDVRLDQVVGEAARWAEATGGQGGGAVWVVPLPSDRAQAPPREVAVVGKGVAEHKHLVHMGVPALQSDRWFFPGNLVRWRWRRSLDRLIDRLHAIDQQNHSEDEDRSRR